MNITAEAFLYVRNALEAAGVRYAVGGSWASGAFGEPRYTNDIDILADLTLENLDAFLARLPAEFFSDRREARELLLRGRAFNIIHMASLSKFDLFPARAFPLGLQELERAKLVVQPALDSSVIPFVTPEDILLAKLHWYRAGGEVSSTQRRDIEGIVRSQASVMDWGYLRENAAVLGVEDLLPAAEADRLQH